MDANEREWGQDLRVGLDMAVGRVSTRQVGVEMAVGRVSTRQVGGVDEVKGEPRMNTNQHECGQDLCVGLDMAVGRVSTRQVGHVDEVKSEPRMNTNEHEWGQNRGVGLVVWFANLMRRRVRLKPDLQAVSDFLVFSFVFIRVHSWFPVFRSPGAVSR